MNIGLIRKINATKKSIYLAITGGGQGFIGDYLSCGGGSAVIKGAIVPYSQAAFDRFVKVRVDNYASEEAARKLAVAAYNESIACGAVREDSVGVGAASSLVKDGERLGREHRINIAIHQFNSTRTLGIFLATGGTRLEEESKTKTAILAFLGEALKINDEPNAIDSLRGVLNVCYRKSSGVEEYVALVNGQVEIVPKNVWPLTSDNLVIFPGSWNPYHVGHDEIIQIAKEITGENPILELTVANADKGQIDYLEIDKRVLNLVSKPHVLTTATTFVEKVRLFTKFYPGRRLIFIVGSDTWNRLWKEKYGFSIEYLYSFFWETGVRFLVFPRDCSPVCKNYYDDLIIGQEKTRNFKNATNSSEIRKKHIYATNAQIPNIVSSC